MGDVQEKLKSLEARRQELLAVEARAAANAERAKADLEAAQQNLAQMGFTTVEAAQEWLQKTSEEIHQSMTALDKTLTEAGV